MSKTICIFESKNLNRRQYRYFYNFMIKVLSSDEQKTNKEEEETN